MTVTDWVRTLRASPDARGDIVLKLRRYRGLPSRFPNRRYLYEFVRDALKLNGPYHLGLVPALYDEYSDWVDKQIAA